MSDASSTYQVACKYKGWRERDGGLQKKALLARAESPTFEGGDYCEMSTPRRAESGGLTKGVLW